MQRVTSGFRRIAGARKQAAAVPKAAGVLLLRYLCATFVLFNASGEPKMITVSVRKQGGAAIVTIPADVMRLLNIEIGSTLNLDVKNGTLTARPAQKKPRRRYTLKELLSGVTQEDAAQLIA